MEPKIIFIVEQSTAERVTIRRAIDSAFIRAGILHTIIGFETVEEAAASFDRDGPPHLILCDKDSEVEDAGLSLLRHVRHAGNALVFILWGKAITDGHRNSARQLDAICYEKQGQATLDFVCRRATELLRGQGPRPS